MKIVKLNESIYRHDKNKFTYFESKFFYDLLNYRNDSYKDLSSDEVFLKYITWIYNNFQLTKKKVSFNSLNEKLISFFDNYLSEYKTYKIKDKGYYLLIEIYHKGNLEIPEKSMLITGFFVENDLSEKIPDYINDSCVFDRFSIFFGRSHQGRLIVNDSYSEQGVIDCIASMLGIEGYRIDSTTFNSYLSW